MKGQSNKNLTPAESFTEHLKWWKYVRWLSTISFLSVGILQMAMADVQFPRYGFVLILLGIMLLNLSYSYWVENFYSNTAFPMLLNFLDILIFSLSIYMTGGIQSPLIWSYLIPILTSSITLGRRFGFFTTIASLMGFFFTLFFFEHAGHISHIDPMEQISIFFHQNTRIWLSYTCLFFLVYFISSFLVTSLHEHNEVLAKLNDELGKRNVELTKSRERIAALERRRVIDRMARTMQRELADPIAAIAANAEMLLKEEGRTYRTRVDHIITTIMQMKNIMSKIEKLYKNA